MLSETKLILHKLKTEGIGTSIASMHRGLDLLSQLIESEPDVAAKYFKGVAAACEHISGVFLGENYVKPKNSSLLTQSKKPGIKLEKKIEEYTLPENPLDCASFILDGMKEPIKRTEVNTEVKPDLNDMQSAADAIL